MMIKTTWPIGAIWLAVTYLDSARHRIGKQWAVKNMSLVYDIYDITRDTSGLILWLQDKGIIGNFDGECPCCLQGRITLKRDSTYSKDGFVWGYFFFIVLGFNNTSILVGHFVSSPREREKRDRRGDEREGQGRKRNRNESEETEEIKHSPLTLPATRIAGLAQLYANISWTPQWRKIHDTFATPDHPSVAMHQERMRI